MKHIKYNSITAVSVLALLAACGTNDATPDSEAELAADLADKQAEVAQLQEELAAQRDSASAPPVAGTTAPPPPARSTANVTTPKPSATPRPAAARPATTTPTPPPVTTVTVPAGTELALSLSTGLSSKSAKVGDTVRARVANDVVVDGRTAIPAGTTVAGSVMKVVSGSDKIGGTPTLVLAFDRLELGGRDVPISGEFTGQGKSDTTRDTVKIVGGAAAGALLGDQVSKKDRGKVIGGILGAAAGAVAAKETGTEVKLTEGTALNLTLASPVELSR